MFFANPIDAVNPINLSEMLEVQTDCDNKLYEGWMADHHVGSVLWTRTGDTFENLSLSPSIDCSKWGGWHGFITNGIIS